MKRNIIKEKSFEFALMSIELYKKLIQRKEYVLSKQFIRSATSIGANVEEAGAGQSKRDFIAKMSIASKEAREANYWIRLMKESNLVEVDLEKIQGKSEEILRLLTSIVKSAQQRLPNS